ncbi:MAG: EAL domain-containing protein [Corynebacteriales bacterium]|nr:EAL domain-containing protein [Mycobacteriales bacterium]
MSTDAARSLDDLLGPSGRVRSVYQPILDLQTRVVVGYEALARFPRTPELGPAEMFTAARDMGVLGDLDWECRRAAMTGALRAGVRGPLHLFINLEPSVLGTPPPWRVDPRQVSEAVGIVPTVIELTERALLTDPRSVLWAADWARERSCLVALDDVGVNPDSMAMLSVIRPDIIKLDRVMLGPELDPEHRRTLRAVWDHVSDSDCRILCEGIESEDDLDRARALGASLVQGYHLGMPGPLQITPDILDAASGSTVLAVEPEAPSVVPSVPADLLRRVPTRTSPLRQIATLGSGFEEAAARDGTIGLILLSIHLPELFTATAAARFAELAESNTLVGVVGAGTALPDGVRGAHIQPLREHVALAVVDPDGSTAVVARNLGDTGPVGDRRYEWAITHDEREVAGIARALLRRLAPLPSTDVAQGHRIAAHATSGDHRNLLSELAETAARAVPGAESVGLSLVSRDQGLTTIAANDQYPVLLDQLQQLYGVGPSLEPSDDDTVIHISDLTSDERWPEYSRVINSAAPIGTVLSFRLFTGLDTSGFITFYAQESDALDASAVEVAHELARHAQQYWISLRALTARDAPTPIPRSGLTAAIDDAVGGPEPPPSHTAEPDTGRMGRVREVFDRAVREGRSVASVAAGGSCGAAGT